MYVTRSEYRLRNETPNDLHSSSLSLSLSLFLSPPLSLARLTDLHRSMSTQVKSSVTSNDEEVGLGAWPQGATEMKGGKKGDILKLVRQLVCTVLQILLYV